MNQPQITARNHYVPESYLYHWTSEQRKLWVYRTLVPNEKMRVWDQKSARSVGFHQNLYTRIVEGGESDEIEVWLNAEFEQPAYGPIHQALSGHRLSQSDWRHIVRFIAAQDARTPVRMMQSHRHLTERLPELTKRTLEDVVERLKAGDKALPQVERLPFDGLLPIHVEHRQSKISPDLATLQAHVLVGRSATLFSLKVLLEQTIKVLYSHRWTILKAPANVSWCTSDNPVVKLILEPTRYKFTTGWGVSGTTIFMPLGPHHILYTVVGGRTPQKGSTVSHEFAQQIQEWIVQNAHRYVFAAQPHPIVEQLRPRNVNLQKYREELSFWSSYHVDQAAAQREFDDRSAHR